MAIFQRQKAPSPDDAEITAVPGNFAISVALFYSVFPVLDLCCEDPVLQALPERTSEYSVARLDEDFLNYTLIIIIMLSGILQETEEVKTFNVFIYLSLNKMLQRAIITEQYFYFRIV